MDNNTMTGWRINMATYSPSLGDNWIELLANRKWSVCAYGTVDSSMEPMVRLMADNPNGSRTFMWVSVEDLGIADVWQQVESSED